MTDSAEIVVIGAGVIGLAVARVLAGEGREVLVLESNRRAGEETSSRNSGVIHSGIYYPPGSLKAQLCVRGRELLYEYCRARNVAHRRTGKLVIAQQHQLDALRRLFENGGRNGVDDLHWLEAEAVRDLEPAVQCAAALYSPSTGIVDAAELLLALQADVEAAGGVVVPGTRLTSARPVPPGLAIATGDADGTAAMHCSWLINCAGHGAVSLARNIEGYPPALWRQAHLAKGNYFVCGRLRPFSHLVYPMPNAAGLGIHATLGLDGTLRFGPDVEWVAALDYRVDPQRAGSFEAEIRNYWPALPDNALQPDYAGVRPKIVGPAEAAADFVIEDSGVHGIDGLINLFGIESPGLTASLAIAENVAQRLT